MTSVRAWQLFILLTFTVPAITHGIEIFEPESFETIANRHADRTALVVIWSIECSHCKHDLARIAARLQVRPDLRVELIATDPPALRNEVQSTLETLGLADAPRWQFGPAPAAVLRAIIDPDWFGELPRNYLLHPDGTRTGISGRLPEAALDHWAESSP